MCPADCCCPPHSTDGVQGLFLRGPGRSSWPHSGRQRPRPEISAILPQILGLWRGSRSHLPQIHFRAGSQNCVPDTAVFGHPVPSSLPSSVCQPHLFAPCMFSAKPSWSLVSSTGPALAASGAAPDWSSAWKPNSRPVVLIARYSFPTPITGRHPCLATGTSHPRPQVAEWLESD